MRKKIYWQSFQCLSPKLTAQVFSERIRQAKTLSTWRQNDFVSRLCKLSRRKSFYVEWETLCPGTYHHYNPNPKSHRINYLISRKPSLSLPTLLVPPIFDIHTVRRRVTLVEWQERRKRWQMKRLTCKIAPRAAASGPRAHWAHRRPLVRARGGRGDWGLGPGCTGPRTRCPWCSEAAPGTGQCGRNARLL